MRLLHLFTLECGRLLRARTTWIVIFLTVLSPMAGLFLYQPAVSTTLSIYMANPALAGGIGGGILFALLTIYEWDRVRRGRMELLMDAVLSPLTTAIARLTAMMTTAGIALGLTMAAWLPYTYHAAGAVFDGWTYVLCYLVFMGMAFPLSILIAASAEQFTGRFEVSVAVFAAMAGLSLTTWSDQWQLCWLNPCVWALSDDFSNFRIFRSVGYMRLTWLLGLAGVWSVSYLCIRRYGKKLPGSLVQNARRIYRPLIAVGLITCCVWSYLAQPFLDHSNPDTAAMTFYQMPYLEGVACYDRTADVHPDLSAGTVSGTASYRFQNITGQEQPVAFAINPGYRITSAQVAGEAVPYTIGEYQESNMALLTVMLPAGENVELLLSYEGFPQEWNISAAMQGGTEISHRYLCLENQDLAPYLLNVEASDGVLPASIQVTLPESMTAIPFGLSEAEVVSDNGDGTVTWRYEGTGSGGILYAGDYVREDIDVDGLTIQFYYGRKHQPIMEAAGAAEAVRAVAQYCAEHYGLSSFASYGTLKLIQSRVSGGGYAIWGASLLDEADSTAQNLKDAGKGAVPGEVMIHELVHQWWGLGNMFDETSPDSPWSAEGLTVYTTYRIVKELYGAEYARECYVEQWQEAVDAYERNFYVRHPEYLDALPEDKQWEISNQLSQVRQYSEMPLKILKAEELVGGEQAMDQILHTLFNREIDPMYPYLTYEEFLNACGLTEEDLNLD